MSDNTVDAVLITAVFTMFILQFAAGVYVIDRWTNRFSEVFANPRAAFTVACGIFTVVCALFLMVTIAVVR